MAGKKRSRNGEVKGQNKRTDSPEDVLMAEASLPCEQPPAPLNTSNTSRNAKQGKSEYKESTSKHQSSANAPQPKPIHTHSANHKKRQKLPRLPNHATISKRPLLHAAIPTPFTSSASPKVLYITASSPYIPAIKRVRKLLSEITRRLKQSHFTLSKQARGRGEATGHLKAADVERKIAEEISRKKSEAGGEAVYLKATGRAIPRALELGLHFQSEEDCWVRVEMGNVRAIDDIEVGEGQGEEDDDMPETRIRTLSSVTVRVGLK